MAFLEGANFAEKHHALITLMEPFVNGQGLTFTYNPSGPLCLNFRRLGGTDHHLTLFYRNPTLDLRDQSWYNFDIPIFTDDDLDNCDDLYAFLEQALSKALQKLLVRFRKRTGLFSWGDAQPKQEID
jgi:hypothetical protein